MLHGIATGNRFEVSAAGGAAGVRLADTACRVPELVSEPAEA
ncbi:hypothetical protein [Streptomyces capparidis]